MIRFSSKTLVAESDYKVAIYWIRDPSKSPNCLTVWIRKIAKVTTQNVFLIHHVPQAIDIEDDTLARLMISSSEMFFFVSMFDLLTLLHELTCVLFQLLVSGGKSDIARMLVM
ncbi:hypothetical protein V6N11_032039 [Hibiscus sabdariffa]|uniref:Uncharacterized protein n=1 Tax=Hibiscus sabdariffa TaxID=183260 RepID=A0ABR2SZR2_9ROSI